ncbi:MAG: YggS family pyridoxal phosphate-dependent enzyme [Saprospiraceae bacterium]|nr:YggS family pyridoxal phosphate-dependent enzyme [Saprospiraceae bacterium]
MCLRKEILKDLQPYGARLVAVSKTKPIAQIREMYEEGQRIFGENRVQELVDKRPQLPSNIEWHLIGHLQRNKVKYIADFVQMIHSVDSIALAREINKQAQKHDRVISILLQVRIAREETKFGIPAHDLDRFLEELLQLNLTHLSIEGLMGMATFTDDEEQIRKEFTELKNGFDRVKASFFPDHDHFREISMGMSGDYKIALEEGSTLVRIGSLIFGAR